MHKALVILTYALGLLASLAAIVAFPAGLFLLAQVERTLHAESYRPATFTVASPTLSPVVSVLTTWARTGPAASV